MKDIWADISNPANATQLLTQIEESELWEKSVEERTALIQNRKVGDQGIVNQLMRNTVWYCLQNGDFSLKSREGQSFAVESDVLFETLYATIRTYDPKRTSAPEGGYLHYFRKALKHNRRKDSEREEYQIKCGMNLTEHARRKLREIARLLDAQSGMHVNYEQIADAMHVSMDTVVEYMRLYKLSNSVRIDSCDEDDTPFQLCDVEADIWKRMEESNSDELHILLCMIVSGIEATVKARTKQNQKLCFSFILIRMIREMHMRGDLELDEAILWTAMVLQFTEYMVVSGDTFQKLELNRLLHKLDQASIADFADMTRANISDQMKKFGVFVKQMAMLAKDK